MLAERIRVTRVTELEEIDQSYRTLALSFRRKPCDPKWDQQGIIPCAESSFEQRVGAPDSPRSPRWREPDQLMGDPGSFTLQPLFNLTSFQSRRSIAEKDELSIIERPLPPGFLSCLDCTHLTDCMQGIRSSSDRVELPYRILLLGPSCSANAVVP